MRRHRQRKLGLKDRNIVAEAGLLIRGGERMGEEVQLSTTAT
jgi:hypothetical protein